MRTEIGFIRPSRLARLRAKALRCRERWCYRAMVPIPPNGPSPPPFPFALVVVDSSSPSSSTFHALSFFFSVLLPVSYRLSTSFYSFLPTFLISSSHSFLRLYVPFLLIHILCTTGTSTKYRRSRASANPSVALRAKCLNDNNLSFDLTPDISIMDN